MELKEVKKTKKGELQFPDDWLVLPLGELLTFKNGLNKESKYFGYGTPIINYMDVFNNHGLMKQDIRGEVFLTFQEKNNFSAKNGDVFFTRTSETQEEIGTAAVLIDDIEDCVFSGFVLRGRPFTDIASKYYFQYCLTPQYVREQIVSMSSYTTRALTNGTSLAKVNVALPPTLTEQKAIAQVLSDTDALIQALEKKIAKKKLIKQGVMQKLLTPKEGWVVKALDDILTFGSGQDYKHLSQGNIPVHGTGGVMTFVSDFLYDGDSVGIGRKGTIDKPVFLSGKFWTVDTLFYTHSFVNTIPKFIYYTFLMIPWKAYNEASGVPSLNKYTLGKIEIALPPTIEEQKQIAQTITDMDKEIGNLAQKLSKYQIAKQGMMQQLLTGKIRLV